MVAAVRAGGSQRSVARRLGVGLATVQLWLARAGDQDLDRVDWQDRSSARRRVRRTDAGLEDHIIVLRRQLRQHSVLGEYGAAAIRRELLEDPQLPWPVPSLRTIARILERRGATDGRWRSRRRPPPTGWYLPDVAARRVELDSFDLIDGLRLKSGADIDVLTGISLHGGLAMARPERGVTAEHAVRAFAHHWREVGLPGYAQFDNDPRFIGGANHPDSIGAVIRVCLSLGVVPVFAPPLETGFQAAIESFNGRWQAKFWARFTGRTLVGLQARSAAWIEATRRRSAARIESAPARAPFPLPLGSAPDPWTPPSGRLIFLRRTDRWGRVSILNRRYPVDRTWLHRLVRAELDIDARRIRCYALRRREPADQRLLREFVYRPPARWFTVTGT